MKKILLIAIVLAMSTPLFAGGGHHGTPGPRGPQGPAGPRGPQGEAGLNGLNGTNGQDASTETKVLLSGDLRIWDLKHASLYFFDNYNWFDRHNDSFGVRVSFKLGDSYEGRQIKELRDLYGSLFTAMQESMAIRDREIESLKLEIKNGRK